MDRVSVGLGALAVCAAASTRSRTFVSLGAGAFIQEMDTVATSGTKRTGRTLLYFGCRYAKKDYLYDAELNAALKRGELCTRSRFPDCSRTGSNAGAHVPVYLHELSDLWLLASNQR